MNIKNISIFITLLLICLILTIPCYANIYIIKDMDGKAIYLTNIYKLSQQQIESGCTISLLIKGNNSTNTQPQPKTTPAPEPPTEEEKAKVEIEAQIKTRIKELENQPKADIVFVDSTNRLIRNYYYVEGILKNKGKGTAYYVKVEIRSLDKYDKLVSIAYGYAEPSTLASGQEATYQIMVDEFGKTVSWNNS
jgi:hypothetical protein